MHSFFNAGGAMENLQIVKPEFYSGKFKSAIMYRFNQSGNRYYFTDDPNKDVTFYPSVTTIISNTMPMSYGLKEILGRLGVHGHNNFMREKALYGTLLHVEIGKYLKHEYYDYDEIPNVINIFCNDNNIRFDARAWQYTLTSDMAS